MISSLILSIKNINPFFILIYHLFVNAVQILMIIGNIKNNKRNSILIMCNFCDRFNQTYALVNQCSWNWWFARISKILEVEPNSFVQISPTTFQSSKILVFMATITWFQCLSITSTKGEFNSHSLRNWIFVQAALILHSYGIISIIQNKHELDKFTMQHKHIKLI